MSRCFPFPPPGYEKKAGPDYENLLEKEKEKKHKKEKKEKKEKDKKDKEKDKKEKKQRDGKRIKDKEKIEDKHREYDDQNEKCKEKSYTAEKEQNRNSDGKYIAGVLGCSNGENLVSKCTQSNRTSGFKFLGEMGKRIRDEDKATAIPIIRKINLTCKRTSDLPGEMLKDNKDDERKIFRQSNKVHARGNGNGSGPNFMGGSESKVEGVAGLVDKYAEKKMEQKENDKHKSSDSKVGRHKDKDRDKKSKSKDRKQEKKKGMDKAKEKAAFNLQPNAKQNNVNAVFDNNGNLASPLKENNKNSHLGKRKEIEMNGNVLHDDDIGRSKLQRLLPSSHKVEENRRKLEARTSTQSCLTSTKSVSELVGTVNNHKVHRRDSSSCLVIQNGPKLGFSSDKVQFGEHSKVNISVQPSHQVMENGNISEMGTAAASEWQGTNNDDKADNKVSLFHPVLTNGKVKLHQAATDLATGVHAPISSQKVNDKEIKLNGLIEDKKPDVSLARPSVSLVKVEKSVGKSLKPPHPDSKYLNQLLNIPGIEWSGFDEQEWLLGSTDPQARSGTWQTKETKQVLRIESADITALPYVIPF